MMKKVSFVMALALAVVFCFTGCTKPGSGLTFTVALGEDISAVDPGRAWDYTTNQVTNQITEGLVTFDFDGNIIPELARSWHQPDDLTYVYDVRDDIVFSDGTKMTMDDVLFSFQRAADPAGGTVFAHKFEDVENFSVSGWQFTIKLKHTSAVFKFIPAGGSGRIISKAYYEKNKSSFGTATGGIVGTGPFAFEKWTSGQEIVLKKNMNYWNKEKLAANIVDTLVFKIIPDETTRVIALQTGEVDFTVNVPTDMLDQLSGHPNLTHISVDSHHQTYLAFNTQRAPMNDINVRKAISRALNLSEFHRNIIKDLGTAGNPLPFGPASYGENAAKWRQYLNGPQGYSFNLAEARQFLARSAYPNGFNCDVVVSTNSLVNQRALYLQEALRPLNINVTIRRMSGEEQDNHQSGNVFDANGKRDYDMIFGGWEGDFADIDPIVDGMYASIYAGENGYNAAAYVNSAADRLLNAQRAELDSNKRFDLQAQLMDIIVNDTAYITFDYTRRHSVLNKKYTGLSINSAWLWVLPVENVRKVN